MSTEPELGLGLTGGRYTEQLWNHRPGTPGIGLDRAGEAFDHGLASPGIAAASVSRFGTTRMTSLLFALIMAIWLSSRMSTPIVAIRPAD